VTRLYLPATVPLLAELERVGNLPVRDVVIAPDDSEDTEYDALMTAAEASAALAAELGPGERRRVVVVADVSAPGSTVGPTLGLADVVAVHADAFEAPDDTDPGDLGWYATQEIPDLLR
jgi:hypothetical protein